MHKFLLIAGTVFIISTAIIFLYEIVPVDKNNQMKYILQWTSVKIEPFTYKGIGQELFLSISCPVNNCLITPYPSLLNSVKDFDAIMFNARDCHDKYVIFPTERSLYQKYIFVSTESSAYYPLNSWRYDRIFNWTMTYKLNSDIYLGYIIVKNKIGKTIGPKTNMHWLELKDMKPVGYELKKKLGSKRLAAAWFVSNCNSKSGREMLALELQKELAKHGLVLDIYSEKCTWNGTKSCPRYPKSNVTESNCFRKIEKDYFFYLSFENSLSEDYVTEKLLTAVQNYAVPIVYGGANYTRFLPDGSYLDVRKLGFGELVNIIVRSIENKDKYYDFFKWTNHYSYHNKDIPENHHMCGLCSAINDADLMQQTSIYENMQKWWSPMVGDSN